MEKKEISASVLLPLEQIDKNAGQIEGLPKNPRTIKDEKFKKLKKSIKDNPEMLRYRELLVYPYGGRFVIIGGNMRYEAMKSLGMKEAPCKVIDEGATVEQLRAYVIKDNAGFGEWDFVMLGEEWDCDPLGDWGVDMPEQKATEKLSALEFSSIYYEPEETPNIDLAGCVDTALFDAKMKVIEESGLSEEKKEAMKLFAYRFLKIDFESVANYYAFKATEEEKEIIERLRLVLVDGGLEGFIEDDLINMTNIGRAYVE